MRGLKGAGLRLCGTLWLWGGLDHPTQPRQSAYIEDVYAVETHVALFRSSQEPPSGMQTLASPSSGMHTLRARLAGGRPAAAGAQIAPLLCVHAQNPPQDRFRPSPQAYARCALWRLALAWRSAPRRR